jgi:hypothetical protein
VCQVVDLVPAGDGMIVHLRLLPGLVDGYRPPGRASPRQLTQAVADGVQGGEPEREWWQAHEAAPAAADGGGEALAPQLPWQSRFRPVPTTSLPSFPGGAGVACGRSVS